MARIVIHDNGFVYCQPSNMTLNDGLSRGVLVTEDNIALAVSHRRGQEGFFALKNARMVWLYNYVRVSDLFGASL